MLPKSINIIDNIEITNNNLLIMAVFTLKQIVNY